MDFEKLYFQNYYIDYQSFTSNKENVDNLSASGYIDYKKSTTGAITEIGNNSVVNSGDFISQNYVKGVKGWGLFPNGDIEAQNGTFRGTIFASAGTFAGALTAATGTFSGKLTAGSIMTGLINLGDGITNGVINYNHTAGAGDSLIRMNKLDFGYSGVGLIMGIDDSDQRPKLYMQGTGTHFAFNGVDVETQGTLIAATIFKCAIYTVAGLPVPETTVGYYNPTSIT